VCGGRVCSVRVRVRDAGGGVQTRHLTTLPSLLQTKQKLQQNKQQLQEEEQLQHPKHKYNKTTTNQREQYNIRITRSI
jgi:hypothetical protein